MNREEVYSLIKEYSNDTVTLSFTATDHSVYKQLLTGGQEIVPFLLDRLADVGSQFDIDNDPWLVVSLLVEYSNGACLEGFPDEHAGMLEHIRAHILKWGENYLR